MITTGAIIIAVILLIILCMFLDELPAVLIWGFAIWWIFFSDDEESPLSLPTPQERSQQVEVKETSESCMDEGGVWLYDECIK